MVGSSGVVKDHHNDAGMQGIQIPKNGYIYIYCSNESPVDVFFDLASGETGSAYPRAFVGRNVAKRNSPIPDTINMIWAIALLSVRVNNGGDK